MRGTDDLARPMNVAFAGRTSIALLSIVVAVWVIGWSWASIAAERRIPADDWHHPMHADAVGYYVYLPGTFQTGMRSTGISDRLSAEAAENGIDTSGGWLRTKYTYITALMQLPFYLIAGAMNPGADQDGFSTLHVDLLMIAGISYWTAGLVILLSVMIQWFGLRLPTALILLLAGSFLSPLFYYAFRMPGYSHVYSFFLVSLAIASALSLHADRTLTREMLFATACALIAVARPVDALVGVALHLWLWKRTPDRRSNLRLLLVQVFLLMIVAAPQALYWHASTGSWIHYSYGTESFSNWTKPQLGQFLASPQNGLLPWGPLFLLLPLAAFVAIRGRVPMGVPVTLTLAIIIYLCASWHERTFGCSFGARAMVQYVPFLLILVSPLALRVQVSSLITRILALALVLFACRTFYFMALHYEVCYFGGDNDWSGYFHLLTSAMK